ncbi:MAG TPA: hypothetical protein GX699_07960 [Firmicutes bacterium]|nr:hypothetical protein [Bacillota bacterium]
MLKDKVVLGLVVGILADAVKLSVNYLAYYLGFTSVVFWQIVAGTVLSRADIFTPLGLLIGALADVVVTSILGSVFIYLLSLSGRENIWIKGAGFGMFAWINFFVFVQGVLLKGKISPEPRGILVTFVAHLCFGLALAAFTLFFTGNYHGLKNKQQERQGSNAGRETFKVHRRLTVNLKKAVKPRKLL